MKILKNAKILTMNDGPTLIEADLVLDKGKIIRIMHRGVSEAQSCTDEYKEAEVLDLSGCWIMPGMIDSHVHFDASYMGAFFLAAGITSVRNMRGYKTHAVWRDEILAGKRLGPYIYSSGPIADGEDPTIPENDNCIIQTTEDVEQVIAFIRQQGFLWMKTYPSIEPDLYRYLLKRCREEGIPVCGHMTKKMDHIELAENGYICCEHTSSLPGDPEKIRKLAESGMWLCPTHVVCETLPDYVWNGKQLTDLPHYQDLPDYVRSEWERKNKVIIDSYRSLNVHPDFQTIIDRAKTFLQYSDRIMAGTDCAYPGIIPGFAMADELERLVDVYGMTSYAALEAATSNPARHIGIDMHKGKILPGMDADLIVLTANPLENVGAVRNIRFVLQGGQCRSKEELARMLEDAGRMEENEVEIIAEAAVLPSDLL